MEIIEIFSVLGIEPTKDADAVKRAYREKLHVTNPEENPEGFKRLRTAYEEACAYAARTEEDSAEKKAKRDETPSGLWVERAAEIYGNLETRINPEKWRELLEDELLLSLEEEENCRVKLLVFLMDHFRLPTDVWKLLDKKLGIVRDAKRLREHFRADFINYIVSKCVQGEDILFEQFEGAPDAPYDLFLRGYDEGWRAMQEKKYDQAAETIALADQLPVYHPAMEVLRAYIFVARKKKEEALAIVEGLLAKYPEDIMIRFNSAEILWRVDKKEDAAAVFEKLKADNKNHYMANYRLAEWYFSREEYRRAKQCVEDVPHEGDDEGLRALLVKINARIEDDIERQWEERHDWETGMELAKCWLQDGKVCQALLLARELEKQKKFQPAGEAHLQYCGLMAMLYVDEAEYEDAVYMAGEWEKALEEKLADEEEREKVLGKIRQAHLIRIQCFHNLGFKDSLYFERAIEEISSLETGTEKDISILVEKAQIYLAKGDYDRCLEVTEKLIEEYQVHAANAAAMEAWRKQWDAGGVIRCAKRCMEYYPDYARAYDNAANVYLALGYKEELKGLLEQAAEKHVESAVLEACRYQMSHEIPDAETLREKLKEFHIHYSDPLDDGDMNYYEKGLPILTEYLYWYPDAYMLRERALFHRSGQRYKEALADFEKSMEEEPVSTYAFRGMALTYLYMGDNEQALIYMKKAILYLDEEWSGIYTELALIYSRLGDHESALEAYQRYEHLVQREHRKGYLVRRMANTMARSGREQEAYAKLNAYYLENPRVSERKSLERYQYLTDLCQVTEQPSRAAALLEEWQGRLKAYGRADRVDRARRLLQKLAAGLVGQWPRTAGSVEYSSDFAEFYCAMGWQELLYGDVGKAVMWLEKMRAGKARDRRAAGEKREDDDAKEGLCDLIFACILAGYDEKGRRFADALRKWREKDKLKQIDSYYQARKARLWLNFLADYYFEEEGVLQALLDREKETETCRFCTYCICKELEAGRVLLLLRQGRREEALERLRRNRRRQPQDEFAIAIQHVLEKSAGGRVPAPGNAGQQGKDSKRRTVREG